MVENADIDHVTSRTRASGIRDRYCYRLISNLQNCWIICRRLILDA